MKATFGGGCFWCTEVIFQQVKGVEQVLPGYMGGNRPDPTYEQVCSGATGHAEVVQLDYNEAEVSYRTLLEIFSRRMIPPRSTVRVTTSARSTGRLSFTTTTHNGPKPNN